MIDSNLKKITKTDKTQKKIDSDIQNSDKNIIKKCIINKKIKKKGGQNLYQWF